MYDPKCRRTENGRLGLILLMRVSSIRLGWARGSAVDHNVVAVAADATLLTSVIE